MVERWATLDGEKIFKCGSCDFEAPRDSQGAFNIFLKIMTVDSIALVVEGHRRQCLQDLWIQDIKFDLKDLVGTHCPQHLRSGCLEV